MKKLLVLIGLAVGFSHATWIHWSATNDAKALADYKAADGIYTGWVDLIEFNNGTVSSAWSATDPLLNRFAVMDLNTDKFYISTSNIPGDIAANALISGTFEIDLSKNNLGTADGYLLKDVVVNNTIGSAALDEFADVVSRHPGASYTFSSQGTFGNGQLGTVPEPTTMGLMGMGLIGLMVARRRKQKN